SCDTFGEGIGPNSGYDLSTALPGSQTFTKTTGNATYSFLWHDNNGGTTPDTYYVTLTSVAGGHAASDPITLWTDTVGNFTTTDPFTVTVTLPPAGPTATQAVASKTLTQNHAATSFTPVTGSGGTAPLSYSVSPA